MTSAPVLGFTDFGKPFILETDASEKGLGAVLSQRQGGVVRVIAYASRGLRRAEKNSNNYSSKKLELMALKWAIVDKFRDYLQHAHFSVYTDNNPMTYLMTKSKLPALEQRWASALASFDFTIHYRPGKSNQNADALSRQECRPWDVEVEATEVTATLAGTTAILAGIQMECWDEMAAKLETMAIASGLEQQAKLATSLPTIAPGRMIELQQSDPFIGRLLEYWKLGQQPELSVRRVEPKQTQLLIKQWSRLVQENGLLYRQVCDPDHGDIKQLILPKHCLNTAA